MANNNDIIRFEENGIEYFTVATTGESAVSERGLAKMSGIARKTIAGWLASLGENKAPKGLNSLLGKALYLGENIKKNGQVIKAIRSEVAWRIIREGEKRGYAEASVTIDACGEIGINSYIQGKTGWLPPQYQSSKEARDRLSRVLQHPRDWSAAYRKEMCAKVQKWYGFDCSKFYWWYPYSFLSKEEVADMNQYNPVEVKVSKSGKKRISRKAKIHQHLDEETFNKLSEFSEYLWRLVEVCDSRAEFEKKWNRKYGQPQQLEIFDLWEYGD